MSATSVSVPEDLCALRARTLPLVAAALAALGIALGLLFPLGLGADWPNHLARLFIEAELSGSKVLSDSYALDWTTPVPDLASDLFVPSLSQLVGLDAAAGLAVGLALVAAPLGGLALSRVLHGRVTALSLFGFAGAFGFSASWGFVNFLLSTGLALGAFALWVRLAPSWRKAVLFAGLGSGLAVCHALGLVLLGFLAALYELGRVLRAPRPAPALLRGARDGLAFLPGIAFVLWSASRSPVPGEPVPWIWGLSERSVALLSPFVFGIDPARLMVAALCFAGLVAGLGFALRRRLLAVHPAMLPVVLGLLALVLLMPVKALGIWGLHFRFGAVFVAVLAASLRPAPGGMPVRRRMALVLIPLAVLPALVSVPEMARRQAEAEAARRVFAALPPGAHLLPVNDEAAPHGAQHVAALAVIERAAYVPNLFVDTSPVGLHPRLADGHGHGDALTPSLLLARAGCAGGDQGAFGAAWPDRYSHVALIRPDGGAGLNDPRLALIGASARVVLYRVDAAAGGCAPGGLVR